MAPCPEGFYLVIEIIPYRVRCFSVRFNDAIDRTDSDTLGGIVVTFAFNAGGLVDHIKDAIAFADGFGRAFGYACAAGDAVFGNFHGHGSLLLQNFVLRIQNYSTPHFASIDEHLLFSEFCHISDYSSLI
jgi:hypothetical protein